MSANNEVGGARVERAAGLVDLPRVSATASTAPASAVGVGSQARLKLDVMVGFPGRKSYLQ